MIGTKLDRFELIAELASGGMGTVFLARLGGAGGFQRLYAIKRLHEHLARHSEFIEMFLDEARLAARIHHPNVVPILEIGTTDAGYYLVMEYVEGDTAGHLSHVASQEGKVIPGRVAVRVALDVLAGLHAAHEGTDDEGRSLEIVHRDVSPHNILISVDGVSRITDFGIARAASRLAVTRTGQLKGKIAYMAPEQARSEKLDRRADVFATGICLWELLARQRLFKADGEGDTLNRLLYEPIPTLRSVDASIPREIDDVVARALSRDLEKRYATAADFSDALEDAARSLDFLATHREVASCITDVLGSDLSERRADLRAWIADTERRSLTPPPPAGAPGGGAPGGDRLSDRPPGAHVSAYVPPLFEPGALGFPGERQRTRGRGRGLPFLAAAAAIVAGVAGLWWRGQAKEGAGTASAASMSAAPSARPSPAPLVSASKDGPPAPGGAPEEMASAHAVPSTAPPPAAIPPAPSHAVHPPASPVPPASAGPRPASSVPQEMLYNPYR